MRAAPATPVSAGSKTHPTVDKWVFDACERQPLITLGESQCPVKNSLFQRVGDNLTIPSNIH
jgi:hypothetical protein